MRYVVCARYAARGTGRARRRGVSELQGLEGLRVFADLCDLGLRRRDQALVGQVALFADGLLAQVLGEEVGDAGDHVDVRLLHVDEEGTRGRVLARGHRLERRRHTVDHRALELVEVLLEEAVAEDADRGRVRAELLHDQVVVLAGFDVRAVFTDRVALALEARLVLRAQSVEPRERLAAGLEVQLGERVARAGGGRRTEHFDLDVGQLRVDLLPGRIRVRDQRRGVGRIRNVL